MSPSTTGWGETLREVRILNYLRLPDVCTLAATFARGTDGTPHPIDQHPFAIGSHLEIKLGAREELTTTTLFRGDVVSLDLEFGPGSVELLVRGLDRSHALLRSRQVRTFQNQTSSDIVEKILGEASFDVETDPSGDPHEFIQQDNETDWDFIWRLAERIGFELVIEGGTAHFRRQAADETPVGLEWPITLRSFSPRVTAIQQVNQVTLAAQDPHTNQAIEASASTPQQISRIGIERETVSEAFDAARLHIATEPVGSQAEAQAVAQALLDKLANAYVAAEGVCDGNPRIRAGTAVSISGIGQKLGGTYRVAAATHVLRGGSTYETRFATETAHTLLANVGSTAPTPKVRRPARHRRRDQQPRSGRHGTGAGQLSLPRSRRRECVGARAHPERRQRARDADAAGGRRGGADRLRARRHHASVRAGIAVQRCREAGR